MKRSRDEDHYDIVDMTSSYMDIQNLESNISSMLAVEIDMKIRAILHVEETNGVGGEEGDDALQEEAAAH